MFCCCLEEFILLKRPARPEKPLSKREEDELINDWTPQPLFEPLSARELTLESTQPTITETTQNEVVVNGKKILNLVRCNYHGFIGNKDIEKIAIETLSKYGCGTCGPRGFYGTIDQHLRLEETIAKFVGTAACLIFPYGFSTTSSTITTFAGKDDLLIVDKAVSFPIKTGVRLSRAETIYFEHNDIADLKRILKEKKKKDLKTKRAITRRFIVIEGVYYNTSDIAQLDKIVQLKKEYCYRLIMDDTYGIGSIGKTGRGTCEYHNVSPSDVELICGDLTSITSSVGGFCAASYSLVYHQRLHANGYVFSASLPTFLATCAKGALQLLDQNGEKWVAELQAKVKLFRKGLADLKGLMVFNNEYPTPIIHLGLLHPAEDRLSNEETLQKIVDLALQDGVLLTRAKYSSDYEKFLPQSTIRINVSRTFSDDQIQHCIKVIKSCDVKVLGGVDESSSKTTPRRSTRNKKE